MLARVMWWILASIDEKAVVRSSWKMRCPPGFRSSRVRSRNASRNTPGRTHAGTAITNRDIRIINTDTGEFLRTFTLNPNVRYQPRFKTKQDPTP